MKLKLGRYSRLLLFFALLILISANGAEKKYECRQWSWTGDVYERKVVCLEWRLKE
jgi:hypothetical protein